MASWALHTGSSLLPHPNIHSQLSPGFPLSRPSHPEPSAESLGFCQKPLSPQNSQEQPGCLGAPRLACPISPLGFQHGQEHQWCQGRRSQSTRQVILFNSPRSGPVQWTPAGIMGVEGGRQGGSPMLLPSCCMSGVINQPRLPPGEAVITVPFIPAPPGTRPQACSFCSVITS